VGIRVVVGPGSPAEVGEGAHRAVSTHDDIGKVDRTARVAIAAEHRHCQQFDRRRNLSRELDVRQAADEPGIDFAVAELIERCTEN
jgi:hypothetical protein